MRVSRLLRIAILVYTLSLHDSASQPTEWPLCEVIEGNRGTTLNLTAPAHAILNLLTDTTPSTRYAVHARLAADTSSAGCLGIEACALAVDATHVLVTAVGTGQPMLLRVDDTVVDLEPFTRDTLALNAAHPVYSNTAVSMHLLHNKAYASLFEDHALQGDWALVVSLADYDLLIAPHQHTPTLQLVVQVHDNTETGLPLDGRLATIEGLVAYMLDLGMGPMEDGLLVDSNDMWLGVGAWDDGAWDGRRDKAPWLGEEEEEEMGTVIY